MNDSGQPLNPDALRLEAGQRRFGKLSAAVEKWDDWVEYDTAQWPRKVEKHCQIIPTICFNCEAACGLLAVCRQGHASTSASFEGNPEHPGSRGRNCAKGPATLNQVNDPERIRYPLKRVGKRGEGKWERVELGRSARRHRRRASARRSRKTGATRSCTTSAGPAMSGFIIERILHAWGIDGHNSHTNVCSAGARAGYAFWSGYRPAVAGSRQRALHPAAQSRIWKPATTSIRTRSGSSKAKMRGAKICVIDTRLSNTASKADYWMATWPGTEAAILLAMGNVHSAGRSVRSRVRAPVGQLGGVSARRAPRLNRRRSTAFIAVLKELYAQYTPEFAAKEAGVEPKVIVEVAHEIARAGSAFRFPRLAQRGGGKSGRLAGGARAAISRRARRRRRHARRHRAQRRE